MITLVGVGHVFDLRGQVRRVIEDRRPAIVGVELDSARLHALQNRIARGPPLSIYSFVAYVQHRLAREYGTEIGGEMEAAVDAAREVGAQLALIDLDSRHVLGRLLDTMSFGEKARFAVSVVGGLFIGRSQVERELGKFEQNEQAYFDELARHFPSIKKVLIDERNEHMAGVLRSLETSHDTVLAVVGEGHIDGLRRILADRPVEVIRLRELRAGSAGGNASVTVAVPP